VSKRSNVTASGLIFLEAWLLRLADNMGQQLQRHLDPKAMRVPLEKDC